MCILWQIVAIIGGNDEVEKSSRANPEVEGYREHQEDFEERETLAKLLLVRLWDKLGVAGVGFARDKGWRCARASGWADKSHHRAENTQGELYHDELNHTGGY